MCVEEYAVECSIAKVNASEALDYIVDEGVQIHGGYGFHQDYAVERGLPRLAHQPNLRRNERNQSSADGRHAIEARRAWPASAHSGDRGSHATGRRSTLGNSSFP